MLAGHAIYQDGQWRGGHQNEDRLYQKHVRDAFRIFAGEGYTGTDSQRGPLAPAPLARDRQLRGRGNAEYALRRDCRRAVTESC